MGGTAGRTGTAMNGTKIRIPKRKPPANTRGCPSCGAAAGKPCFRVHRYESLGVRRTKDVVLFRMHDERMTEDELAERAEREKRFGRPKT